MGIIKKEIMVAGSKLQRKCEVLFDTGARSKNIVIYHRGERRVRRVLRRFQSLLMFSGAFAFSVCSAVNLKKKSLYSRKKKHFTLLVSQTF